MLSAAGAGFAAGIDSAFLFRETIDVFLTKLEVEAFAGELRRGDGVLRDDAAIVFHFHFEIVVRKNLVPEIEDRRETPGGEAVLEILRDVSLEQAGVSGRVQGAPAVDEALCDMSDFRDVKVRRDLVAIRENKTRENVGMRAEDSF